ncbi:MAG: zeta toxin family protein [Alphaproteobacteria bacterium]
MKSFFKIFLLSIGVFNAQAATLIPSEVTDGWIAKYSPEELTAIQADQHIISSIFLEGKKASPKPIYLATAGGPGSMKSTILENYLSDDNYVRADPDAYGLRYMVNTYIPATGPHAQSQSPEYLKVAYEKWRGGSNYIANNILNVAFEHKLNIAHGTTSTSPHIGKLYEKLKTESYRIELLLCDTTDENRIAYIANREKTFYQSTPEDAVEKAKAFYERMPVYFKYADTIKFFWTDDFNKGSVQWGNWDRKDGLNIMNKEAFEKFVDRYEKYRASKPELLPFNSLTSIK